MQVISKLLKRKVMFVDLEVLFASPQLDKKSCYAHPSWQFKFFMVDPNNTPSGEKAGESSWSSFLKLVGPFVHFQDKLQSHRHLITGNEPICQPAKNWYKEKK